MQTPPNGKDKNVGIDDFKSVTRAQLIAAEVDPDTISNGNMNGRQGTNSAILTSETFSTLLGEPEEPISWLVENIVMEMSRGFIIAEPGAGKTWFAMDLAISISTGRPFLNKFNVSNPGPCLIVDQESSRKNLKRRIHALAKAGGIKAAELKDCHFMSQTFLKIPGDADAIVTKVKALGCKLIVFDSFRRFHTAKENDSTDLQPVLEAFQKIQQETGVSILIIHHLRKSGQDSAGIFERMRGSSDLWAWRETLIAMEPEKADPEQSKVSFQFKDAESPGPFLLKREIMPEGGVLLVADELVEGEKFKDLISQIKAILGKEPSLKTHLIDQLSGHRATRFEVFRWMKEKGVLAQREDRKWVLS